MQLIDAISKLLYSTYFLNHCFVVQHDIGILLLLIIFSFCKHKRNIVYDRKAEIPA